MRARENLRVIRSLMERATIYRAISAPTALVGGLSALSVCGWMLSKSGYIGVAAQRSVALTARDFIWPWLVALLVTGAANTFFIWREAQRDQRPFFSPGLRLALRSVIPSFFVAGAITFVVWRNPIDLDSTTILALSWIGFYGLGLLGTMNFAPRSLVILGVSFVLIAVIWLLLLSSPLLPDIEEIRGNEGPTFAMGLTFGLFHLIYAICTLARRRAAVTQPLAPE